MNTCKARVRMGKQLKAIRDALDEHKVSSRQAYEDVVALIQADRKSIGALGDAQNQACHVAHKQFEELQAKLNRLNNQDLTQHEHADNERYKGLARQLDILNTRLNELNAPIDEILHQVQSIPK